MNKMENRPMRVGRLLLFILLVLIAGPTPLLAAVEAIIICEKQCDEAPCGPCEGEEGDIFFFDGRTSTASDGHYLNYHWDYEGNGPTTSTFTKQLFRPHNPAVYANGWPIKLTVVENGTGANDTAQIDVPIENIAPTAIAYGFDAGNEIQYQELITYVHRTVQFHAEESHDRASYVSVCIPGMNNCGLSTTQWDFSFDGLTFNVEASNDIAYWDYEEVGDYTVRLRVRDDDTPYLESFVEIAVHVIYDGPFASIKGPVDDFTEGQLVGFNGDSTGSAYPIVTWEWDFDYDEDSGFHGDESGQNVSHSFQTARTYEVALRVRDGDENEFINHAPFTPLNILPQADLLVYDAEDVLQSEPYSVPEGKILKFDAGGSYVVDPDPGDITGFQWDWDFDTLTGIFNPTPQDFHAQESHAWQEDSANRDDLVDPDVPEPYYVKLRVIDDDSTAEEPSDDYLMVEVWVTDILPRPEIEHCNNFGADCQLPDSFVEVAQGDDATFQVVDIGGNTDSITKIEWDFYYNGVVFNPDHDFDDQEQVVYDGWTTIGTVQMAVRITDDDGEVSDPVGLLEVHIVDKPPSAEITPNGAGGPYVVDEGQTIIFSAETSYISPDDHFTRFRWDDDYDPENLFQPDGQYDLNSDCVEGSCSYLPFISCAGGTYDQGNDCPQGRGMLGRTFDDGPATYSIALCVEDESSEGTCVAGADPDDLNITPRIFVLEIEVVNVSPLFDPDHPLPTLMYEHAEGSSDMATFSFLPVVIEPSLADTATLAFDCEHANKPAMMQCFPNNGLLDWTPDPQDVSCEIGDNEHHIEYMVCDKDGGCDTLSGYLTVLNVNDNPVVTGFDGSGSAVVDSGYYATLYAEDPDSRCGDNLYYYICEDDDLSYSTDEMSIDINGVFTWTPTSDDVGAHEVWLCARDRVGEEDCGICYHTVITVAPEDEVPIVSAGADRDNQPGEICLVGSVVSNPGQQQLSYFWRQISGPVDVCLGDFSTYPDDPRTCFVTSAHGIFVFGLSASNINFNGPEDTVSVNITNLAPGATVPGDRHFAIGSLARLDGSRSADYNENDVIGYQWTDFNNPTVLDSGDTTKAEPDFIALDLLGVGLYEFELQVDDGLLTSPPGWAYVSMEFIDLHNDGTLLEALPHAEFIGMVCDDDENCERVEVQPPKVGEKFLLDAALSSSRPAGADLEYDWNYLQDGPSDPSMGTLPDQDDVLHVTAYNQGRYTFALRVSDGELPSRLFTQTILVVSQNDRPPTADAGEDIKQALVTTCASPLTRYVEVELDGSGSSDPEQMSLSYSWTQTGGAPVPLKGQLTDSPSFLAFAPGMYTFELIVNDGDYDSEPDMVHVLVAPAGGSTPFTVITHDRYDAQSRTLTIDPGDVVILDASASDSPSGNELSFEWSQTGGPAVVLSSWTEDTVSFLPDGSGVVYRFRLVVWDDEGSPSPPLDLKVVVLEESNTPPECRLVQTRLIGVVGDVFELDASGTSDDDGDPLTYEWRQIVEDQSDAMTITDANQLKASVQPMEEGEFVFEFTANDGFENCTPVQVTVEVSANGRPIADAGTDQEVCVGDLVSLDGSSSSDPDGHELDYTWIIIDPGTTGQATEDMDPSNEVIDPSFKTINKGQITIELVVSDGFPGGSSNPDTVLITVKSANTCDGDGGDVECWDNDDDGYWTGADCVDVPIDCDDTDKFKNTDCFCIDNDADKCCANMDPLDPDDNNPYVTCFDDGSDGDIEANGDGDGNGEGCQCFSISSSPLDKRSEGLMLLAALLMLFIRRRRCI